MENALTKPAVPIRNNSSVSLLNAITKGGPIAWASCLVMGLGNILGGQIIHGLVFLAIEVAFFWYMFIPQGGIYWISMLPSLGWREQEKVWNDEEGIFEYVMGDQSNLILLYGVATILICVAAVVVWRWSVISGYKIQCRKKAGQHINTVVDTVRNLFDSNIHTLLMTPPMAGLLIFTVTPLIYMMCMAFTNYSKVDNHLVLFDWVGVENFRNILSFGTTAGKEFWGVLGWTLIWAFFATFLNFFMGTIVALLINRKTTRLKSLWRGCLCITIAVPQFVSLLAVRSMLQEEGIVNMLLEQWGMIAPDTALPFFTNTTWARITVIVVNLWVGIPYTIMQVTGILKNIPAEQYEAATIDGANAVQTFRNITLPYMIFVMTPQLITTFTGNINNFNVIYLLTGGAPQNVENTAGTTDLLITWLYKMTVDDSNYKIAAVIGILVFVVTAVISLVVYNLIPSVKNEEDFQ